MVRRTVDFCSVNGTERCRPEILIDDSRLPRERAVLDTQRRNVATAARLIFVRPVIDPLKRRIRKEHELVTIGRLDERG